MWPEKFSHKHNSDLLSHLEEFRRRVILSLVVFSIFSVIAYFFSESLLELLIKPIRAHQKVELFFHKPYEAFLTHLKASALAGFFFSLPVLFTQLWLFVSPGLYENEKKAIVPLVLVSVLLFLIGSLFAYFVVVPWGLHFLLSFETETIRPLLGIGPYFSFLIGMLLAFGFLFDFPILVLGLVRFEVLQVRQLAGMRKTIIILIFILAAILTPSPDPISQLLLAVPLLVLFEISLLIARKMEKRQNLRKFT